MIELKSVEWEDVQHFFVDFQKKSKCFEFPPENAEFIGVYNDFEMIGYFIVQGYDDAEIEINQGYLKRQYRHSNLPKECMRELEKLCKQKNFKRILLGTHSRFNAYLRFAKGLGYSPKQLIFSKEI